MADLELGAVLRLRNFRHFTGEQMGIQTLDYSAPKDKVFLVVLIALEDKAAPGTVNPDEAMAALGWQFVARSTEEA